MIPFIKSLNTKLLLIVVCFVALSGILAAMRQQAIETERLQAAYDNRLIRLGQSYQRRVEDELLQRQHLLTAAHAIIVQHLFEDDTTPVPESFTIHPDQDQAFRWVDGVSGVFLTRDAELDNQTLYLIHQTQSLWEHLTPLLKSSFNSFYLTTPAKMTRIWPADLLTSYGPDYDMTQELFYDLARPEKNPQREARWTPIYFSASAHQWMVSLLLPIYDGEQFMGVVGADLDVNFLFDKLATPDAGDDDIKAFIFDGQENLILHGDQRKQLSVSVADDQTLLNERKNIDKDLVSYIHQAVSGKLVANSVVPYKMDGHTYQMSYRPLKDMNWFVSLYYPQEMIGETLQATLKDIYLNIVLLMLFLTFILYYSLKYFVTDRIGRLARATAKVGQHHWQLQVPQQGSDEIGLLGTSINTMLAKINDLVIGLNSNISELEDAKVKADKLTSAIESTSSLIVILNRDWSVEYANPQFWRTSGYASDQPLQGEKALLLDKDVMNHPRLDDVYKALQESAKQSDAEGQYSEWRAEYEAKRQDGSSFWLMQTISAIFSMEGEVHYFVCVGQDISDLKVTQQKIEYLAYYDQLTGLHNRVLFKDQLRMTMNICMREKNHFALMYLDLDHFKRINDTLGHEAGDSLLIEVAYRLKQCLRTQDIIARLGGDEFGVLLHQVSSAQYAYVVATKIIAALNRPILLLGQEVVVGVSIGITLAPDDSQNIDVLMKNADLAMYQAKEKGRNSFQFYTANMNHEVEHRLSLERGLHRALKQNEFELYFQPVIDLKSGKLVAAEALIRWNHPQRGVILPGEFIPIAEDSGLIIPLGNWVIRAACQQGKNIQKALHYPLRIAVNISACQLNHPGFLDDFRHILQDTRLAPEWLELEVTESTLMADEGRVIKCLEVIQAMGVSLAIDDFGTGYSSLSHLKRMPVQYLKVDQSFVAGLPDDDEDRAITSLIVAMANSLDYKVIIEGVETKEQLDFLIGCGCDYAQGFYFSEALPADKFMQLLFHWREADYLVQDGRVNF